MASHSSAQESSAGRPEFPQGRGTVTLTTDSIAERERFDYWRDVVCRLHGEKELRPLADVEAFSGTLTSLTVGSMQITRNDRPHAG